MSDNDETTDSDTELVANDDEDVLAEFQEIVAVLSVCPLKKTRKVKTFYFRQPWEEEVAMTMASGSFARDYGMQKSSFDKLHEMIYPAIALDSSKQKAGGNGNSPVFSEQMLAATMMVLRGQDLRYTGKPFGFSEPTMRRYFFVSSTRLSINQICKLLCLACSQLRGRKSC